MVVLEINSTLYGLSSLCYALKILCPAIGGRSAMSREELAKFIQDIEHDSRLMLFVDGFSLKGCLYHFL
jgi:hypothetical protein